MAPGPPARWGWAVKLVLAGRPRAQVVLASVTRMRVLMVLALELEALRRVPVGQAVALVAERRSGAVLRHAGRASTASSLAVVGRLPSVRRNSRLMRRVPSGHIQDAFRMYAP